MSADDREFIERLLAAGRRDTTPDEASRQTKIANRVLGAGPPPSSVVLRSWPFAAAAVGALVLAGTVYVATSSRPVKSSATLVTAEATSLPVPVVAAAPEANPGDTSVWELPSVPAPKKAQPAPSAETDDLALELAALESARRRLREHDPAGAMKELDDFDRRFPRPRVGDEVAVLRIEVLVALGRHEDAARLGHAFVARHPDSIYRARVAQMIGAAAR